jgi:LacI family transcriptional regulator
VISVKTVTIRDIAESAGVSINTVSRALNDRPDVSATTRARVRAVAEGLDYQPNAMARSLVGRRSRTIGLVVTDCTDPYYAGLIRAIEEVASAHNYALLPVSSNETVAKEAQAIRILRERRVDGILLTAVDVEAPHVRRLLQLGLPSVLVSRRPRQAAGPFVGNDNVAGEILAVRHLLDLGHRRIAAITRPGSASSARERLQGWRWALREAGLDHGADLVYGAAPSVEGGEDAARWLAALERRPTAAVTYNDLQAIGLIRAARTLGIAVPDRLSVVGHDDVMLARLVEPPLTTVAQPISEIGRLAGEMIVDIVQGKTPKWTHRLLSPSLVIRASTAPPGGR